MLKIGRLEIEMAKRDATISSNEPHGKFRVELERFERSRADNWPSERAFAR